MSEGNRRVERRDELQSYPDNPERFDGWCQVLCREGVSGRCYWEVEWNGSWGIHIAVVYKSIVRERGPESEFGHNDQSWSLRFSGLSSSSYFWHNNKQTKLHLLCSSRIGVYVNRRAGTLAFYSVSDTMTLLHRVQTTFTHTLYPGFVVGYQSSMKLLWLTYLDAVSTYISHITSFNTSLTRRDIAARPENLWSWGQQQTEAIPPSLDPSYYNMCTSRPLL